VKEENEDAPNTVPWRRRCGSRWPGRTGRGAAWRCLLAAAAPRGPDAARPPTSPELSLSLSRAFSVSVVTGEGDWANDECASAVLRRAYGGFGNEWSGRRAKVLEGWRPKRRFLRGGLDPTKMRLIYLGLISIFYPQTLMGYKAYT
jgi:hypothetical protein